MMTCGMTMQWALVQIKMIIYLKPPQIPKKGAKMLFQALVVYLSVRLAPMARICPRISFSSRACNPTTYPKTVWVRRAKEVS